MYYYEGNNRGSYDVLLRTLITNDIKFIAEVMNIDDAEIFVKLLNGELNND